MTYKNSLIIFSVVALMTVSLPTKADIKEERAKLQQEFQAFRKTAQDDLESFRKKINKEFAEALKDPWNNIKVSPPVIKPKEETVPPVIIHEDDSEPVSPEPTPIPYEDVLPPPIPQPQPTPIEPINEIPITPPPVDPIEDLPTPPLFKKIDFSFFGTPVSVRLPNQSLFQISTLSEKEIGNLWIELSAESYNNLLYDCLQIRDKHHLDDWPYLMMLQQMGEAVCGKGTNESVLLTAYVFCQSGYKIRLAMSDSKLRMLFACEHKIFNNGYCTLDGEQYYILGDGEGDLKICNQVFPNEKSLSLLITHQPMLNEHLVSPSNHSSTRHSDMAFSIATNKNMLSLYDTYPSSILHDNFMTRWSMYANMPMPEYIHRQLYPEIRKRIQGLDQVDALNKILHWIQTGFAYEYDDEIWGEDRAFFPEESLHYPYCDCEDRSILFSRIVRDIFGLKCVLVFYPGHLAAAVAINQGNPTGDYFDYKGTRFFIADGTIMGYGAPIGQTMRGMDNSKASLILLD